MAKSKEKEVEWYIKKELEKGFSIDDVREALIGAGHSEKIVDNAIEDIGTEEISGAKRPKVNVKYLVATLIIIVIVAGGIYSVRFLPEKAPEEKTYEAPKAGLLENKQVVEFVRGQMERCLEGQGIIDYHCTAISLDDINLCDMSEDKVDCQDDYYASKGILGGEISFCDRVTGRDQKVFCEVISKNDIRVCDGVSGDDKILCGALVKEDLVLCDDIIDNVKTETCHSFIYFLNGYRTNDGGVCNSIKNKFLRNTCSAITNKDSSLCTDYTTTCHNLTYFRDVFLGLPQLSIEELDSFFGIAP